MPLRHAGEDAPRREAVPGAPKVRSVTAPRTRQRQRLSVVSVLGFLAVTILAVVTLSQYVQLTVISSEVVKLQSELSDLQTQNVSLTTKYEQTFDLSTIKEAAEAAGMSKPSSSQIYLHRYVRLRQCGGLPAAGGRRPQPCLDLPEPRHLRCGGIFRLTAAL